jgi:hypothetical protein
LRPFAIASAFPLPAGTALADTLVECTLGGSGGDRIHRGFYLPSFPGDVLDGLDVYIQADTEGEYQFSVTVRESAYDGPIVAQDQVTLNLASDVFALAAFQFPSAPVTEGVLLTFAMQTDSGPDGSRYYDVPGDNPDCPFVETNGTEPPLSTFRRQGVRATLYGQQTSAVETRGWARAKASYR